MVVFFFWFEITEKVTSAQHDKFRFYSSMRIINSTETLMQKSVRIMPEKESLTSDQRL